jgi:polysaccharide export outer membrane protein
MFSDSRGSCSSTIKRKECALHVPRTSKLGSLTFTAAAILTLLAAATGCETKSFLDPSELVEASKGTLLVPILDRLNTGVEEPNDQYANASDPTPQDLIASRTDYTIGKNDLISVGITDLVGMGIETVKTMRVSESGMISLPLIGQLQAEGYTEAQLEQAIAQAYRDRNIIKDAQVSVQVIEARARTFSVLGAVSAQGEYAIVRSNFRVLDALVTARGVSLQGVESFYVIRSKEADQAVTGPSTQPSVTQPGTGGTSWPDLLAPRTQPSTQPGPGAGGGSRVPPHLLILQAAPGATGTTQPEPADVLAPGASPTTTATTTAAPTTGPAETTEAGRYVIIDGKPVLVRGGQQPEGMTPSTGAAPSAGLTPIPAPPPPRRFEFSEPPQPGDQRIIRIPYDALRNGDLKYNIVIRPGDLIYVPDPVTGEFYMGGHVGRVGVYSLTGRKITLTEAVISAGMLDQLAIPERTEIRRRIGNDREVHVRINLSKIFAGKEPNLYMKPYDEVLVGTNALAPFLAAIRGGFRLTYGFGFLYDRNFASAENNKGING